MADTVRVGMVGAGWVATNRHLPALTRLENAEVCQIWSRQSEKARKAAGDFGISAVVEAWERIVESPDVDAVVVATPPNLHHTVTLAALTAGKHVLCQGRMARNLQEANEMLNAAQSSMLVTALYPPRPGLKGDRVMRRLLQQENYVGEIREVRLTSLSFAEETNSYQWTEDPEVFGVGTMTLGLWTEVLNRWVGHAARVAAVAQTRRKQRKTSTGGWVQAVVPDSLAVVAKLECGASATYHFSSRAFGGPGHLLEIFGSRGALAYKFFAEEIQGISDADTAMQAIPVPASEERSQTTDSEFVQAILTGSPVSPDFEDGVRYMAFCDAVAYAALEGTSVEVSSTKPRMQWWGRTLYPTQYNI